MNKDNRNKESYSYLDEGYNEFLIRNEIAEMERRSSFEQAILQNIKNRPIIEKQKTNHREWITCNCGRVKLSIQNGEITLNKTKAKLKPESNEFKLIKGLLENCGARKSYEELAEIIGKSEIERKSKSLSKDIGDIIKTLRRKLGISGDSAENDDIFEAVNGYRIKCKETRF